MEEQLLLTDELIALIAKKFDEKFDFTDLINNKIIGAATEALDNRVAIIALNFSNTRVSQYIPNEYKDEIQEALEDVFDGDKDYTVAIGKAIEVIDQLKDKLEVSDFVKSLIDSFLEMIKAGILVILEK